MTANIVKKHNFSKIKRMQGSDIREVEIYE